MAKDWKSVTDVAAFLARKPANVRTGPHKLTGQIISWPYCINCGIVALKNDATRKALKQPCIYEDD